MAIDPKSDGVVLAGGRNSLLFRSQNAGEKWDLLDFPKRHLSEVTSILVDPADSRHYQAGMTGMAARFSIAAMPARPGQW